MTRLLVLQTTEPEFNLAAEEFIFSQTKDDAVILWQNKNAVIIGRNQNTLSEINQKVIEKHGISVVRRITEGGAVFHDLGNINYSIIAPQGEDGALNFKKFAAPIVEILSELGVKAEFSGRNDLLIDGKKISGNGQRHGRHRRRFVRSAPDLLGQPDAAEVHVRLQRLGQEPHLPVPTQ